MKFLMSKKQKITMLTNSTSLNETVMLMALIMKRLEISYRFLERAQ